MQKKRRSWSASAKRPVEDEIAHLRGLDLKGLRARWQSIFGRAAPAHLTRHLLFAVIAYRLQADHFGDLDHATRQVLDRTIAKEEGPAMSARLASFDQKRTELTPGTVLVREWDRQSQRVMVMADGFAWNGQTYDSLCLSEIKSGHIRDAIRRGPGGKEYVLTSLRCVIGAHPCPRPSACASHYSSERKISESGVDVAPPKSLSENIKLDYRVFAA